MNSFSKSAAIAGVVIFAAGSAAWAQAYKPNPGTSVPYTTNPGTQANNPSTQSNTSPGAYSPNQQGLTTFERAKQELNREGYKNIHDLKSVQHGWSAEAERNGQNVNVTV